MAEGGLRRCFWRSTRTTTACCCNAGTGTLATAKWRVLDGSTGDELASGATLKGPLPWPLVVPWWRPPLLPTTMRWRCGMLPQGSCSQSSGLTTGSAHWSAAGTYCCAGMTTLLSWGLAA